MKVKARTKKSKGCTMERQATVNEVMEVNKEATSRKRLGRAQRRRRRKQLEIQRRSSVEEEEPSTRTDDSHPSVLPTDRGTTLQAVSSLRQKLGWKKESDDEAALVSQLGYLPGNAIRVSCRAKNIPCLSSAASDDASSPVCLQLYPLAIRNESGGRTTSGAKQRKRKRQTDVVLEPFPTMFWLTQPQLRVYISQLEVTGLGTKLEKQLSEDDSLLEQMKEAHLDYERERHELLTAEDQQLVLKRFPKAFEGRGIAGIRNPASIKCLHAHAAHYLSGCTKNWVGKIVMEEVEKLSNPKEE